MNLMVEVGFIGLELVFSCRWMVAGRRISSSVIIMLRDYEAASWVTYNLCIVCIAPSPQSSCLRPKLGYLPLPLNSLLIKILTLTSFIDLCGVRCDSKPHD